jgi:hypothetical protein
MFITKSKEVKTGYNLAELPRQARSQKLVVLPMMMIMKIMKMLCHYVGLVPYQRHILSLWCRMVNQLTHGTVVTEQQLIGPIATASPMTMTELYAVMNVSNYL